MFEFILCSMVTILPDYLYRRYWQGKRIGSEITLFSMWFELRRGITACILLTVALITVIFYFHPSTTNAATAFRSVTILPETGGRVAEVYVNRFQKVEAGAPLFRLDSTAHQAALDTAISRIAEIDAQIAVSTADLAAADGQIQQAEAAHRQAEDDLNRQLELQRRNAGAVAQRDVDRQQSLVDVRKGAVVAAIASKESLRTRISTLLPAQKASAEAAARQARIDIDKTVVRAGVAGTVQQFTLRVGEVVNPLLRPAGILVPTEAGRATLIAGFSQIEAQVIKRGMIAEATCIGKPYTIIPLVVTDVQEVIAAGQVRASDQLVDAQQFARPGTLTTVLEPLYPGVLDGVPPGSSCIVNGYSNHEEELHRPGISTGRKLFLHVVDATALVHAMILRIQALVLPVRTLVLGGH
ncbi:MAG: HlyD family secretion protein [Phreatobacter sp.]|uniref:HlyD family secretion protein n=1 Tax=Phreatobacter sp. TaxID=1966341 RepID=UPI001A61B387|nr:biotin/lipoyl-binding protein [Phreatobacter sp.]MBL8568556.1 HlyD family secretion protein [Phreatobacter sp.]